MNSTERCAMPERLRNHQGEERRVGVEIELSGLGYDELVEHVARLLKGSPELESRYVSRLEIDAGTFTIELDSDPVKDLDLADERLPESIRELGTHAMDVIDFAAERIVPLEIVGPPLPFSRLGLIEELVDELRELGAEGSREAIYFAFGLQLNPELPDLEPATIVTYLQAFAALYDWLKSRHQIDISRKFTTYIEPWSSRYTDMLMAEDYAPDQASLMKDYLNFNPTRNKAWTFCHCLHTWIQSCCTTMWTTPESRAGRRFTTGYPIAISTTPDGIFPRSGTTGWYWSRSQTIQST